MCLDNTENEVCFATKCIICKDWSLFLFARLPYALSKKKKKLNYILGELPGTNLDPRICTIEYSF